jgi:hypothetical protein
MDTREKVEKNIEIFYERNTIHIPEVEKKHYFKDQPGQIEISNKADDKTAKQFNLYKGFLASERVKLSTQGRIHQVIPDDSDPRNLRFARSRVPMVEQHHYRRYENSADSRNLLIEQQTPEYFKTTDLKKSKAGQPSDVEKVRLLDGYQDLEDISYPSIIQFDQKPNYDEYYPIMDDEEPVVNEVKPIVKTYESTKTQYEPIKIKSVAVEQVTNRPVPSKDNFVIHEVKPDDTIGKL